MENIVHPARIQSLDALLALTRGPKIIQDFVAHVMNQKVGSYLSFKLRQVVLHVLPPTGVLQASIQM
jgi:hypothetical protein